MQTTHKISGDSVAGYAAYLTSSSDRGDYYTGGSGDEPDEGVVLAPSRWHGSPGLLAALGLSADASVEREDLAALMRGVSPADGRQLRRAGGDGSRVAGIDMTFSAPKSVSALWAVSTPYERARIEAPRSSSGLARSSRSLPVAGSSDRWLGGPMSSTKPKRSYGSGSVVVHRGSWYGRWRVGDRYVKRKLGAIREPGTREGLTRKQAEMALRRQMTEVRVVVPEERMTVQEAGDRYLHHVEHVKHRKPSTVQDYRIILNKHLVPHFGSKSIDRIDPRDVVAFITVKSRPKDRGGLSRKTLVNHLNFAHGLFAFALRRGWCTTNPIAATDRPEAEQTDPDIRFLDLAELEALLAGAAKRATDSQEGGGEPDVRGHTDHVLYLTAAMTGMRLGKLIALRWRDVDWSASVIRVRRNYTRGNVGTPKSRRSSRALPMADRLGGELDHHYKRSLYQGDEDLVFCHPQTGDPYDASQVRIRFYAAMKAAGMGHRCGREGGITFHSLRHTFGTRMAAAGVPMRALQEWMGHRNLATTEIYADYAPDPMYGPSFAESALSPKRNPTRRATPAH